MHTPITGENRPKTALPIPQAALLASECKRLARELEETAGLAEDLKTDYPALRELRPILAKLTQAAARLKAAHLAAYGLWDAACEAQDRPQGGSRHA